MTLIQRLKEWWNRPSEAEQMLENKVVIDKRHWDGFPKDADECRRSYMIPNRTTFMNVNCPVCGDGIHRHDVEVQD